MRRRKAASERRKSQRRKAQRLYHPLQVSYKLNRKDSAYKWVACRDISGVGIGLLTNEPLKVDDKINLSIYLKGNHKPLKVLCKVVWCSKRGPHRYIAGLEFIKAKNNIRLIEFICDRLMELSLK